MSVFLPLWLIFPVGVFIYLLIGFYLVIVLSWGEITGNDIGDAIVRLLTFLAWPVMVVLFGVAALGVFVLQLITGEL